MSAKDIYRVYS